MGIPTAALSRVSSRIMSLFICSRPAVSTGRAVWALARRAPPRFTRATTSVTPAPRVSTSQSPACRASRGTCSAAAGRYTSAAMRNGAFCSSRAAWPICRRLSVLPDSCASDAGQNHRAVPSCRDGRLGFADNNSTVIIDDLDQLLPGCTPPTCRPTCFSVPLQ